MDARSTPQRPASLPARRPRRRWSPSVWRSRLPRRWPLLLAAIVAAVALVAFILHQTDFGWKDLHALLNRLPAVWTIALMAVLPLTGFSVALVYLVAGARFGPVTGGAVVAGITAFHLLASHVIARGIFRRPLERFLARRHHALPRVAHDAQVPASVMLALLPGAPYFIRNYLIALSGIPLRIYFWICLPIYVLRSYVTLALGDQSDHLSVRTVVILGGILIVKLSICGLILLRLRRRHRPVFETGPAATSA